MMNVTTDTGFAVYLSEETAPVIRPEPLRRQPLPPMGGGQEVIILDVNFAFGDRVAVVIQGDGPNGVFVGSIAGVDENALRLCLTCSVGPIPAGSVVAIRLEQIAAVARLNNS